jgi:acetyltransferase-like isoleucine patch superfamily enzyme
MERPERPLSGPLGAIRTVVRRLRLLRWQLMLGRRLRVGKNVVVGGGAVLVPPRSLYIGSNVSIGRDFHVEVNVKIGPDVLISSRVAIVGRDHRFDDPARSVYWAGRLPTSTVTLEGDNLIGFGTIIVGPCTIGKGCIVGAGSVVVGDLAADTVYAGVPARPIRPRYSLT